MTKPEKKVYMLIDYTTASVVAVYPSVEAAKLAADNTAAYVDVVAIEAEEVAQEASTG